MKLKVEKEVGRLLVANFIKSIKYTKRVSNVVVVPKKNEQIRVCIDITNINKSYFIRPYHLLRIYDPVDATTWYQ